MKNKNLLISFSGGRTSAYMAYMIKNSKFFKDYNILTVFSNTGKEKEETLKFVDDCDKAFKLNIVWIEAVISQTPRIGSKYKVVNFETADRTGKPFEGIIQKFGVPSKSFKNCSRDLKIIPIHKYAFDYFGTKKYLTAIGFRADERHRMGTNVHHIYPLIEAGISETDIRNWWEKQSFDLKLKDYQGNCDLCFLKSMRKKLTVLKEDASIADWWLDMEAKHGTEKAPFFDMRGGGVSVSALLQKSKEEFATQKDKHQSTKDQALLFPGLDLDKEFDCLCKFQ